MNVAVLYRSGRVGAVSITDVGLVRAAHVDDSITASGNHAGRRLGRPATAADRGVLFDARKLVRASPELYLTVHQ
jgi:hypothetical protein